MTIIILGAIILFFIGMTIGELSMEHDIEKYGAAKGIKEKDIIYRYKGYTYGCISSGQACSLIEGQAPFFEMPLDSIREIV